MTDSRQEQALVKSSQGSNRSMSSNNTASEGRFPLTRTASNKRIQQQPQPNNNIGTKPTLVEKAPMRFLIMDAPRQSNLAYYIREMKKNNVTEAVRVCEPTLMAGSEFSKAGIRLYEMEYKDGTPPSSELIAKWLKLVETTFYTNAKPSVSTNDTASSSSGSAAGPPCIAVHCVAGLGRAPVMVAIALIEFAGMDPVEAVSFLRSKRRGAINEKQLLYLSGYRRTYTPAGGPKGVVDSPCQCTIL